MIEDTNSQNPEESESSNKEIKKETYRKKVWDQLVKNKVASFPNPYGRIPNFKGAAQAAAKLLELEEFKSSQSVEVNPDKPLEASRMIVLENGKELYVPVPGLQEYVLKKLSVQDGTTIKRTVSRWGIDNTGQKIDITDTIRIDLLVLGSVAVSKEGYRIGKGKGYADIEYALLKEMKAIDDETVIVTVVHDLQVFDTLPKEAFKEHDVPVDYILTPTQIIKTENRLPRPAGIYWELLSQKQINSIKVLRTLKKRHKQNNPSADTSETKPAVTHKERKKAKLTKTGNENSSGETVLSENTENIPPKKSKKKKRKHQSEFSLFVRNIEKNVRVRDLKKALMESGIKPYNITWRGYRGICYLHYATKNRKEEDKNEPYAIDNVIEILKGLKITPDCKKKLDVKVMEPITRIETTGVTSV